MPWLVDPDTVGQYTGNPKIGYDGDIIAIGEGNVPALVFWDEKDCAFKLKNLKRNEVHDINKYSLQFVGKIIGNRWDNPDLLED